MRDESFFLKARYNQSRALVIGINKYENASPLAYAVNDAKELANVLIDELGFPKENVETLYDEEATRGQILKSYLKLSNSDVELDDRILVFFAGHGHTREGIKGEVGYLIPFDADMDDPSTLIRWEELTKNSELIRAKHILFVMDACYGGLAINRKLKAGSTRFLKNMLQRYSRQVITAGKADEAVSDGGGPLPGHSVFTGHLIEGLRGKAANEQDVISANGLMSYIYQKVANDQNSNQTPHYGQFDGDGDFIISAPGLDNLDSEDEKDIDRLIVIPATEDGSIDLTKGEKITKAKELLSMDSANIELHDFVVSEVRHFLAATSEDNFPLQGPFSQEELLSRLSKYESLSSDLSAMMICIAHWAKPEHLVLIDKVICRHTDRLGIAGGLTAWIKLRWYPLVIQTYCIGVAAIEANRFDALYALFYTRVYGPHSDTGEKLFIDAFSNAISDLVGSEIFKQIPGHERQYTPISEYLHKLIQPDIDELLFVGKGYEKAFDKFELFLALIAADVRKQNGQSSWGPIGRFGWKHQRFSTENTITFDDLLAEAKAEGTKWRPLQAGFFGGSLNRFVEVAEDFKGLVSRLNWW